MLYDKREPHVVMPTFFSLSASVGNRCFHSLLTEEEIYENICMCLLFGGSPEEHQGMNNLVDRWANGGVCVTAPNPRETPYAKVVILDLFQW